MLRRFGLVVLLCLTTGCDDARPTLLVDLKTDLLPGRQFFGVRTTVRQPDPTHPDDPSSLGVIDRFATQSEDYLAGQRVAELSDLPVGTLSVEVALLGPTGEVLAARETIVSFERTRVVTVLLTGSCTGVTCPSADDDPVSTACVGGRCVDPRCSPETPEFCGALDCSADSDCESAVPCGVPRCIDSECFVGVDDARCASTERCDPRLGCVVRPDAMLDAGPECPATETSCSDGLDDDCDGDLDCADADCLGVSCDDASACTDRDVCGADGSCGGDAIDCADTNDCTDDTCDAEFGCTHTDNTAACDDGFWCNGADTCRDGMCQDHGTPPCAAFCNETTMVCEECSGDADCGAVSYGTWGACGGFGGTCGETGTQSRAVMTPRCNAGACEVQSSSEGQSCARVTEDVSCGTTTYSAWGACGGYANACDETGTQSRTRTRRLCRSGGCANVNNSESRGCSRTVPNGTRCGTVLDVCCGGACRSMTSNGYCGGCGVSCTAIGRTCRLDSASGGYACSGCAGNAECQSILNGAATCWDLAAPPARCECQCAANGVCANAGCGANMYCHDCPGHNFCSPNNNPC